MSDGTIADVAATHDRVYADYARLARIALTGRAQDVQSHLLAAIRRYRISHPELADTLASLLREAPSRGAPLRRHADVPVPVDTDTRLQLVKVEAQPALDFDPVLPCALRRMLDQVVLERMSAGKLLAAGLEPTRTVLFTGPPGVGKTLAARWLASKLSRPLLVLDLAAVMSSYLGRTGSNLRHVLDYAKSTDCLLLVDELDAIAKRRDDGGEIGELKRLVTVLLQEIDDWPSSGLLVAATNHPDLLDPAIWRRFDMLVKFQLPAEEERLSLIRRLLDGHISAIDEWAAALAIAFDGRSFSDIQRDVLRARRSAAISGDPIDTALRDLLAPAGLSRSQRILLATQLAGSGILSQRRISELMGVARDTLRTRTRRAKEGH